MNNDDVSVTVTVYTEDTLDALRDVFALIDENWLVRNTSDDGEPGWGMRQLPIVIRLAKARRILDAANLAALADSAGSNKPNEPTL